MTDKPPNDSKVEETPRQRFVRIANRRVRNVVDGLDKLKPLANGAAYQYTQADVQKIEVVLLERVASAMAAFKVADGPATVTDDLGLDSR